MSMSHHSIWSPGIQPLHSPTSRHGRSSFLSDGRVSASTPSMRDENDCLAKEVALGDYQSAAYLSFLPSLPYQEFLWPIAEQDTLSLHSHGPPDHAGLSDHSDPNRQSLLPPAPEHPLIYKQQGAIEPVECRLSPTPNQDHFSHPSPKPRASSDLCDVCANHTFATSSTIDSPHAPSLTHSVSAESIVTASLPSCTHAVALVVPSATRIRSTCSPIPVSNAFLGTNTSETNPALRHTLATTPVPLGAGRERFEPSRPVPPTPPPEQEKSFFLHDEDDENEAAASGIYKVQAQPMMLKLRSSIPDLKLRKASRAERRTANLSRPMASRHGKISAAMTSSKSSLAHNNKRHGVESATNAKIQGKEGVSGLQRLLSKLRRRSWPWLAD